jgi:hypothetical protein
MPTEARPVRPAQEIELYGLLVPADTPRISVELLCYRTNRPPSKGGLGAHQHFRNAFALMWPDYEMSEWVDEIISAWCNHKFITIIGHLRASKTFTVAHCVLLDYLADPTNTLTSLATVTFEGLKLRMWSDFLKAAETAKGIPVLDLLDLRSSTNEMKAYPLEASKESAEKYMIHGMAVNKSKDAEGRIRGGHAPRRRVILDEAQDIADAIFDAAINPMSAPDAKFVLLSNPVEKISKFGEWCEPALGWSSVTENTRSWPTKKGGICLHLDGLQSPNITQSTRTFTGLFTRQNLQDILRLHGEESVQYWSQVRGWFPPDGMVSRIFPSSVIEKLKPQIIFDYATEPVASLDPAFEWDDCVLHFGDMGKLRDLRPAISATDSETFVFKAGPQAEPKDHQIAHWVMARCKARGLLPKNFIMDKSGGGRGVYAILQKEWSPEVQGIDYGGSATERPLRADEPDKCCDIYEKFVTELWFRCRAAGEDGILGGLSLLNPKTIDDLHSRRYTLKKTSKGTVQVAETKDELKKRLGRSPDNGDAFTGFAELLIRLGHGPGRAKKPPVSGSRWSKQRTRAIAAAKRYSEQTEFAH